MTPTPIEPARIGATIKKLRTESGLTMTELSKRLGVSVSTVSLWESGERVPKLATVCEIMQVCNKQIYYVNQ